MKVKKFTPEQKKLLRDKFSYDADCGVLRYMKDASGKHNRGKHRAGDAVKYYKTQSGALVVQVKSKGVQHHFVYARVCWFLRYGQEPSGLVDHKDRNPHNNKIENLRIADKSQNACNSLGQPNTRKHKLPKNVYVHRNGYRVSVKKNYRDHSFGVFKTIEEAVAAADRARLTLHGDFARAG